MMCDNQHDDRIKMYGYCSLCNSNKMEKPINKKSERK